jgi:two-component system OmpR family response regulator
VSRTGQPASPEYPRGARVLRPAVGVARAGRADAGEHDVLRSGDLVLDRSRWTVHRAGEPVTLSPTEFRLLACLMRHQGRVLTRTELLLAVWGPDRAGRSRVLETYVSYLRRKLDRLGPPLIHTRRGVGYLLGDPAGRPAEPRRSPRGCPPPAAPPVRLAR